MLQVLPNLRSKILFLGCNYPEVPYLEKLQERGFYVAATDINPHAPGMTIADSAIICGYNDFEGLEKAGLLHQSPSKLANLINSMKKEDFLNWWKNKRRQLIVNSFKKKYAAAAENPMYTLTKKIYNA